MISSSLRMAMRSTTLRSSRALPGQECSHSACSAVGEMKRALVPGGRLLLLDHVGSTWPPVYAAQWLAEQVSRRTAGEYLTRRQLPLVQAAGFEIHEVVRLKAGTVERVHARKIAIMGTFVFGFDHDTIDSFKAIARSGSMSGLTPPYSDSPPTPAPESPPKPKIGEVKRRSVMLLIPRGTSRK